MADEIRKSLYRIVVPLPNSPLKDLNSYVIKGEDRNLIIDTGFNRSVCYEAMLKGLAELEMDLNKTDFMLTHMHADHTGLVTRLASETSKIFFSRIDSRVFDDDQSWQPLVDFAQINGFPADELQKALANHPGFKYSPKQKPVFTLLNDGDVIECGGYRLQCIATPGHTQGHICLYEKDRKIFFSGDHILLISRRTSNRGPIRTEFPCRLHGRAWIKCIIAGGPCPAWSPQFPGESQKQN